MGGVQPIVLHGQPHLPTTNRTTGNPAKLQDEVPIIMRVTELMVCRVDVAVRQNTSMFQTIQGLQFGTLNYDGQVCRSSRNIA